MGSLDFDPSGYQPRTEMAAVPAGKYLCKIEDTERKSTKNGDAQYLQITHTITEGEYKGRKIFDRLNLWSAQGGQWVRRTDQAGTIAGEAMADLCLAVGIGAIRNHEELRGKHLIAKVKVRKSEEHGDSNDVQKYYPVTAGTATTSSPVAPPAPQPAPTVQPAEGQPAAQPATTGGAPWAGKPAA